MDKEGTEGPQDFPLSRLIGESPVVNRIEGLLVEPVRLENGGWGSVDDLVFRLKFRTPDDGANLAAISSTVQCDGVPHRTDSTKANAWRVLCSFAMGTSTVRLGVGFNEPGGRVDMTRGMLQLNPNKVSQDSRLDMLLAKVRRAARDIELKRWDFAIDVSAKREDCRLVRDGRGYEYWNHGRGVTEYLGTRNKPGRTKLYDKSREADIEGDWTRLELTCDGSWGASEIARNLPKVFRWADNEDEATRAWVRALGLSLALNIEHGEPVENILAMLSRDARAKVQGYLGAPAVEVTEADITGVLERVEVLRRRVVGGQERVNGVS